MLNHNQGALKRAAKHVGFARLILNCFFEEPGERVLLVPVTLDTVRNLQQLNYLHVIYTGT